ncbi:MAG: T9SS type A sorting domain-containing protein, partial [Chitinophagaceae bacterium]
TCSEASACPQNGSRTISRAPAAKARRAPGAGPKATVETLEAKAYPNPFRNTINIAFRAAAPGKVRLEVYDMSGRRTAAISYGYADAGTSRTITFTPKKTLSSLMLYRLSVGSQVVNGRILQHE